LNIPYDLIPVNEEEKEEQEAIQKVRQAAEKQYEAKRESGENFKEVEARPRGDREVFGRKVPSLWRTCIKFICANLDMYDGFEEVPMPWKAEMFVTLSRAKKLTYVEGARSKER
jgi:hypothetical protein